jgi:hypothetical protein
MAGMIPTADDEPVTAEIFALCVVVIAGVKAAAVEAPGTEVIVTGTE